MDPVSLILGALMVGATAAAQDTATQAIKDTYASLKSLVQRRFAEKPQAEMALVEYEKDPDTWKKPLEKLLVDVGAANDEELVRQAQQVMKLVNPQQAAQGKYNVQIGDGKGVVVGDNPNVNMTFGKE